MQVVRKALDQARGGSGPDPILSFFDLRPHGYQQTMLDTLAAEREHGHTKNLVVAPRAWARPWSRRSAAPAWSPIPNPARPRARFSWPIGNGCWIRACPPSATC